MATHNILIVDDEEEICDYLKEIIEETGEYNIKLAYCGEEVEKAIGEDEIDIAFVDLKMSTAMSGIDVIKYLKERFPDIKITSMTGYVDAGLMHQVQDLGIVEFMEKPMTPKVIFAILEKLLK